MLVAQTTHFFLFLFSSSSLSLLSFKTYISPLYTKLFLSWRFSAAFLLSLAPVRPGCSLFLASFPSFSLWPTPIDRVSPNRCLKARHEAVSFEAAEWSERLTIVTSRRVGWLGAAAVGSIPALVTFFSFSSLLLLLFISSFEFLVILTFLHYGIEEVETHLRWKFHKKIQRKSWSNVPPKLLVCIGFLYKVVHKNGRLRKFDRAREIEFNFFTLWTISMKCGTLVYHVPGYKKRPQIF